MEVHKGSGILFDLPGVDKHFGEAQAVADVCRAASPLPALVYAVETLLLLVTAAVTQVPLCAGGRNGMGHPRGNDGIGERSLFTALQSKERGDQWHVACMKQGTSWCFSASSKENSKYAARCFKRKWD